MSTHPLEAGLAVTSRWVAAGTALSIPLVLLPVPGSDSTRLLLVVAHLVALTATTVALTLRLAPIFETPAFGGARPLARHLATDAALVAFVTTSIALLTLVSSASLRYPPSLQHLQLLAAVSIGWSVAGLQVGLHRLRGVQRALLAGTALGAAWVASVGVYLATVGFGPGGRWTVDGGELTRIVLPLDVLATILAISALVSGARRMSRRRAVGPPERPVG